MEEKAPRIRIADLGGYKRKRTHRPGSGRKSLWPFKIWTHLFFAASRNVKWIDKERRHFRTAKLWQEIFAPAQSMKHIETMVKWGLLEIESRLPGSMVVKLKIPDWMEDDTDSTESEGH